MILKSEFTLLAKLFGTQGYTAMCVRVWASSDVNNASQRYLGNTSSYNNTHISPKLDAGSKPSTLFLPGWLVKLLVIQTQFPIEFIISTIFRRWKVIIEMTFSTENENYTKSSAGHPNHPKTLLGCSAGDSGARTLIPKDIWKTLFSNISATNNPTLKKLPLARSRHSDDRMQWNLRRRMRNSHMYG